MERLIAALEAAPNSPAKLLPDGALLDLLGGALQRYALETGAVPERLDICPQCGALHVPVSRDGEDGDGAPVKEYPFSPYHEDCWYESPAGQQYRSEMTAIRQEAARRRAEIDAQNRRDMDELDALTDPFAE